MKLLIAKNDFISDENEKKFSLNWWKKREEAHQFQNFMYKEYKNWMHHFRGEQEILNLVTEGIYIYIGDRSYLTRGDDFSDGAQVQLSFFVLPSPISCRNVFLSLKYSK